jgi:hypothetical protein
MAGKSMVAPAIEALHAVTWQWPAKEFDAVAGKLGIKRHRGADREMPIYKTKWGPAQAIIEGSEVVRFELFADVTHPVDYVDDELIDQSRTKFDAGVAAATALLGKPAFNGGFRDRGFPDDEDGIAIAEWKLATARMMIVFQNVGEDMPVSVSIVIRPPAAKKPAAKKPAAKKPAAKTARRR